MSSRSGIGTTAGLRRAWRDLLAEIGIWRRHRAALRQARRFPGPGLRLNAGCGPKHKPGWVNIDLTSDADLQLDLREPLPFADGAATIIYSEHFFEHLGYPEAARTFLREAHRVLQPGGLFRVGVPDAESMLRTYVAADVATFRALRERWHPAWCTTPMHSVNYFFRQAGEHHYAYDWETLRAVLAEAGFVAIERRPFDPDLDSEERREGTLYVEARRPNHTA